MAGFRSRFFRKSGYDPAQPRAEDGRWSAEGGGASDPPPLATVRGDPASVVRPSAPGTVKRVSYSAEGRQAMVTVDHADGTSETLGPIDATRSHAVETDVLDSGQGIGFRPKASELANQTRAPDTPFRSNLVQSLAAAQGFASAFHGRAIGGNFQCAALVKALTPGLPHASQWQRGTKVRGTPLIPVGTPIAIFNFYGHNGTNGYGAAGLTGGVPGRSHAAIYLGQDANGIKVLHQYTTSGGPIVSTIPWDSWGKYGQKGGDRYYIIKNW